MTLAEGRYSSRRSVSSGAVRAAHAASLHGKLRALYRALAALLVRERRARTGEPRPIGQRSRSQLCSVCSACSACRCTAATCSSCPYVPAARVTCGAAEQRGEATRGAKLPIQENSAHSARGVAMQRAGTRGAAPQRCGVLRCRARGWRGSGQRALLAVPPVRTERVTCRAVIQRAPLNVQRCCANRQEAEAQDVLEWCWMRQGAVRRCRMRCTSRWRQQRGSSQLATENGVEGKNRSQVPDRAGPERTLRAEPGGPGGSACSYINRA